MSAATPLVQLDGVTMGAHELTHHRAVAMWCEMLDLSLDQVHALPRKERIEIARAWEHFSDLLFDLYPLTSERRRRRRRWQ